MKKIVFNARTTRQGTLCFRKMEEEKRERKKKKIKHKKFGVIPPNISKKKGTKKKNMKNGAPQNPFPLKKKRTFSVGWFGQETLKTKPFAGKKFKPRIAPQSLILFNFFKKKKWGLFLFLYKKDREKNGNLFFSPPFFLEKKKKKEALWWGEAQSPSKKKKIKLQPPPSF